MTDFEHGPLGQKSEYPDQYTASVLHPIPRQAGRQVIGLTEGRMPFAGYDIWNAYELSWLNPKGKPVVALLELRVPAMSENIIESKSLKLYLGSFNQTRFVDTEQVLRCLQQDLGKAAKGEVEVSLFPVDQVPAFSVVSWEGKCLDELDIEVRDYSVRPELLTLVSDTVVEEKLFSHLLRSCCPVTGQPDWASVWLEYRGRQWNHEALLRYLISFRNNQEFHEQCVERVYLDIMNHCAPESLTVYARYTRRGGIDINPVRSSAMPVIGNQRLLRQ